MKTVYRKKKFLVKNNFLVLIMTLNENCFLYTVVRQIISTIFTLTRIFDILIHVLCILAFLFSVKTTTYR